MAFQPSADSCGICRLWFRCSWWNPRQANDALASEPSIFSENHDYKGFFRVAVNTYISIFRCLDVRGGRKLQKHTHTQDNYSNPCCAHARRGLIIIITISNIYTTCSAALRCLMLSARG